MSDEQSLLGYSFPAFGSKVRIEASGPAAEGILLAAAREVKKVSETLTRFDPTSPLCQLNADRRSEVQVEPLLLDFIDRALEASRMTDGLIDPTLLPELEAAGYRETWSRVGGRVIDGEGLDRTESNPDKRWREIHVDHQAGTVTRPPGVRFDAGGIGKGMAADMAAVILEEASVWSVDCLGDIRVGGGRLVEIASPERDAGQLAEFQIEDGALATSGTTRRSWKRSDGSRAHHLIDPRTGQPSQGDLVQVSALAPTAVEAEARAKAALLTGLDQAQGWLPHGGIAVDSKGHLHLFRGDHG